VSNMDRRNTTCGSEASVESRPDVRKGSLKKEICLQFTVMSNTFISSAGSEVLTAVVMKNSVFWNIMLRAPLKIN
jgi:hypothetical protein